MQTKEILRKKNEEIVMNEINGKFDAYLNSLKNLEGIIQILGQFDNSTYNLIHTECSQIRKDIMDLQNKVGTGIGTEESTKIIFKIAEIEHKLGQYLEQKPEIEKSIRAKQREIILSKL